MQNSEKIKSLLQTQKLFKHNLDVIIVCVSLLAVGAFLNGIDALTHAFLCVGTCVACEFIGSKFILKKFSFEDLSAVSTGLIIALMLPVNAAFYIGIIASMVAILVAKIPFGSAQSTPFVPACVGFCAISVLYPQYVFSYVEKASISSFFTNSSEIVSSGKTLLDSLMMGNSISLNLFTVLDLLSGSFAGAIGTTSLLALLGGFIYLVIQNYKRLYPALSYIGMCAIFAILFPRVDSGIVASLVMELCAGSLVFVALILISDPVTSPQKPKQAALYGAFAGAVYMLLRYYGKVEDPACFSVLIANAVWLVFSNKEAEIKQESMAEIKKEAIEEFQLNSKDKSKEISLNLNFNKNKKPKVKKEKVKKEKINKVKPEPQIEQNDIQPEHIEPLEIEKRDATSYIDSIIQAAKLDKQAASRLKSYAKKVGEYDHLPKQKLDQELEEFDEQAGVIELEDDVNFKAFDEKDGMNL